MESPLNYITDHIILCLIKYDNIKTYGEVVIQLHLFFTLVLGVKGKASRPDRLTPGKEPELPIERGLRDGLDLARTK